MEERKWPEVSRFSRCQESLVTASQPPNGGTRSLHISPPKEQLPLYQLIQIPGRDTYKQNCEDAEVTFKSLDVVFFFTTVILGCCSVAQSWPTLCNAMDCSMPGFPVLHYLRALLKFMSTEVTMPASHLILCHPLLLPLESSRWV